MRARAAALGPGVLALPSAAGTGTQPAMVSGLERLRGWLSDPGVAFRVRVLRADLANFFLLQYRSTSAFLITGKNSGTHWLKYMLGRAIAHQYGVPPPEYSSGRAGDTIIAHPRHGRQHAQVPFIGSSHTIPSVAFAWNIPLLRPAPTVVLVRDIRSALQSNYVKWREQYGVSLTEYLAGDPHGRRFIADVWWYMHFFNRWGDVARRWPDRVLIVRYEDIQAAPGFWLQRVATHLGAPLDPASIEIALPFVTREAVRAQLDPSETEIVIPEAHQRAVADLSAADAALLAGILRRHLRHWFGYDAVAGSCQGGTMIGR